MTNSRGPRERPAAPNPPPKLGIKGWEVFLKEYKEWKDAKRKVISP